jgi:hypothetical protein
VFLLFFVLLVCFFFWCLCLFVGGCFVDT